MEFMAQIIVDKVKVQCLEYTKRKYAFASLGSKKQIV